MASQSASDDSGRELAIEVKGLTKSYGRTQVLRGLDLNVRWGEVIAILGPNGSGKTTLIKALATLTRPDEGTIRIANLSTSRSGERIRRVIGVVTHDSLLYPDLTGYENLSFYARMFRLDSIDERVRTVTEKLGMTSRLDQKVGTLSHGMQKRFSIARALLHDPLVLIMDEPESGLDQEALALLDKVITDRETPTRAVLITTHNLERGLALADRMAILSRGRIAHEESVESTEPAEMREAYFRYTGVSE
ncbi:MAG: ABC transporter ATP-binding protein [Chloroflexi bacterium]|nr:ABC transporter ATP-binding protein [Chloroflexota bacterium]